MTESFVFEIYHENSKLSMWDWEQLARIHHINVSGRLGLLADAPPVDIACLHEFSLPVPRLPDLTFESVLKRRRSALAFEPGELKLTDLSALLHFSNGLNGALESDGKPWKALRFCPSPGALYPLALMVESRQVAGLRPGVHFYDAARHALGEVAADLEGLSAATQQADTEYACACRLWIVCRFDRLTFKYGERSYRFAVLEAGHIAQNVLLIAAALSVSSRPLAGFLDDKVIDAIGLDGHEMAPLYVIALGASKPD